MTARLFSSFTFALLCVVLICPASGTVRAQRGDSSFSSFLIGPIVSASWNNHTGSFRAPEDAGCPAFGNGSGFGYGFGLSAEFRRTGPTGRWWSISPALIWEERPATADGRVRGDAGITGPWAHITYRLLGAEVMSKLEVARIGAVGIGLKVGPAFQYVLGGRLEQRYLTEEGTTVCFDGEIPGKSSTRFFAKAGAECIIGFGKGWAVTPGIYYEHGLTGVLESGGDWKLHSVIAQMGLSIQI